MKKYFYLIHVQYLGFRFHGWAKQPNVKTIHQMIDKTLPFVLGHRRFKTLGSSRTDAMVSANHAIFELFLDEPMDIKVFLYNINSNLPTDIRVLTVEETDASFNVIQAPRSKEYLYLFAFGEKCHPFSASIMSSFMEHLDIAVMQETAKIFEGKHNFKLYCTKPSDRVVFEREIACSYIEKNTLFTASFFPENSYLYRVRARGFMRNQVRLMMGQLLQVGRGKITPKDVADSLSAPGQIPLDYIAPPSGLMLYRVNLDG